MGPCKMTCHLPNCHHCIILFIGSIVPFFFVTFCQALRSARSRMLSDSSVKLKVIIQYVNGSLIVSHPKGAEYLFLF